MDFILISGLSGSGKSVALNVLEDEDYYCVDNLPSSMLERLVEELQHSGYGKAAVAVDIRSGKSVERLPTEIERLKQSNPSLRLIFLDARDDTLIRRFSETRRRHPLSAPNRTLEQAISEERRRLEAIAALGHRIDTSDLKANALRQWIRQFAGAGSAREHLIIFQSFGFKHGIPLDADLVFDVRCLPNPHYESDLQALTGLDAPVATFLEAHDEVGQMGNDIRQFVSTWLPAYLSDGRSVLNVAVGCTGGQHRSVYLVEWLRREFGRQGQVLVRHRSLA